MLSYFKINNNKSMRKRGVGRMLQNRNLGDCFSRKNLEKSTKED